MRLLVLLTYTFFIKKSLCHRNNVCPTLEDYLTIEDNPNCNYDPAADNSTFVELSTYYGYTVEDYTITTKDSYILSLFRIYSNGSDENSISDKQPVILFPGHLNSALPYLGQGVNSLPFLLVNAGYDVWLGNFRGTEYSEGHLNLTVYDTQYWDFTIDDLAIYDVPAQLNYVLEATNYKQKIIYIGYSMGASTGLMFSSLFPEEAKSSIKLMVLFGPLTGLRNTKASLYKFFQPVIPAIVNIIKRNHLMRLTSQTRIIRTLMKTICMETPQLMNLCMQLTGILTTGPLYQISFKTLPVIYNQLAGGASFQLLSHFANMYNGFTKFDYGKDNIRIYGRDSPPVYQVSQIKVPIFSIYAINDYLVTPEDSKLFYNQLSYEARYGLHKITEKNFNHFDYLYGRYAKELVYDVILKVLNRPYHYYL